jgi:hypothetical protein
VNVDASFRESSAEVKVEQLPLSHLSIELGHLYMEDFEADPGRLDQHFRRVAPWAEAARRAFENERRAGASRISTCFLIDDYFMQFSSPKEVIPTLLSAARGHGLTIDYLARESACAQTDGVAVAALVESRLVADPTPGTTGTRPPALEVGWLCNGQRSPGGIPTQAMRHAVDWEPPRENARNRHSVFLDVELWDETADGRRTWSCPFLAAVWQLLRLGLLRNSGEPIAAAQPWSGEDFPDEWDELPAVSRLTEDAKPFSAYRTLSVLAPRFLPIEHAVRTILSQVMIDPRVAEQVSKRAAAEQFALPPEVVSRIAYVFADAG